MPLFVDSEWCPSAKKYDLFPLFVASKWCPSAKKYGLLPLFVVSKWRPSAKKQDLLRLFVALEWWADAKKHDLLPLIVDTAWCPSVKKYDFGHCLLFRSGGPVLRSTIACVCGVVSQTVCVLAHGGLVMFLHACCIRYIALHDIACRLTVTIDPIASEYFRS